MIRKKLPVPVITRLVKYLAYLEGLEKSKQERVSSGELARVHRLTSSTVRQDISHLNFPKTSKRGYAVENLEKVLTKILGLHTVHNVVIVGAGNLGRALALHENFSKKDFTICGIFDSNPMLFGKKVGPLRIQSMNVLPKVVQREKADIGVVAVPPSAAQEVSDHLVKAGVRGLINFACTHIVVPKHMAIVEARIIAILRELCCAIKMRR